MGEPVAYCRPCKNGMIIIEREAMGETYWCKLCGTVVELNYSRPTVVIDKCVQTHSELVEEGE